MLESTCESVYTELNTHSFDHMRLSINWTSYHVFPSIWLDNYKPNLSIDVVNHQVRNNNPMFFKSRLTNTIRDLFTITINPTNQETTYFVSFYAVIFITRYC